MPDNDWRCTKCKRPRNVADALPPLRASLSAKHMVGKCRPCRAERMWERVPLATWPPEPVALLHQQLQQATKRSVTPDNLAAGAIPAGGLDKALGTALRDRGMAQAEANEGEPWATQADAVIHALALSRAEFTSEDVTQRVGLPARSPGAVGARMNAAARKGVIRWTGRMAQAQRPNQHAAVLKVWKGAQ